MANTQHKPQHNINVPPTQPCWTCGEPHEGAEHDCITALKNRVKQVTTAYNQLKEQALDAGLTVRPIDL